MFHRSFVYVPLPTRVIFGAGSVDKVTEELAIIGASRSIIVCTPEQIGLAEGIANSIGSSCQGIFPRATVHVPIEIARQARDYARSVDADCIVAVGGGSSIGLAKAIALESSIPILAIPTTYAGSEMTTIYGITDDGRKTTGRDQRVLPRSVIYDPELTYSLPATLSVTSGLNAIAHCIEALYADNGNPIISLMAEDGIRTLSRGLTTVRSDPEDIDARSDCLYGAWIAGIALGSTSVALHHKLCHTLGGILDLPHAETHAVVLPHAVAYNTPAVPNVMARVAKALNAEDAAAGIFDLTERLGAPVSLHSLGVKEVDLDRVADEAMKTPYPNPRVLERGAIRDLLQDAWLGRRPYPAQTSFNLSSRGN